MYKSQFSKLNTTYNSHLYTGFLGYLFKKNHLLMEKNSKKLVNNKNIVLEIGGGTCSHINYLQHPFEEYHCADVDENNELTDFYKKNYPQIKYQKFDGKILPYGKNSFDRIIISHCLEHINYPENFLNEILRVTKVNGIVSIALPTDPGIAWRIGRFFIKKIIQKKTHRLSELDYDYVNAIEHVNSIFNLRIILKKKI